GCSRQPQGPAGVSAPAQVPPQHPLGHRVRPGGRAMTAAKPAVVIYTDAACSGNPGPGGWGAILISGRHRKELSGGEAVTTNNRIEVLAADSALGFIRTLPS